MQSQTIEANINSADCIRAVSHFGEVAYHNICKGTITTVPWGIDHWFRMALMAFLVVFMVGFLLVMFSMHFSEHR
jgi:hypothetical protein